jgi:hypothetical protein
MDNANLIGFFGHHHYRAIIIQVGKGGINQDPSGKCEEKLLPVP